MHYNLSTGKHIEVNFDYEYENRVIAKKKKDGSEPDLITIKVPVSTFCETSLEGNFENSFDNLIKNNLSYHDTNNGLVKIHANTKKGLRYVGNLIDDSNNVIIDTTATCVLGDNFERLRGRKIAFNKALFILNNSGLLNKLERRELFNLVFPKYAGHAIPKQYRLEYKVPILVLPNESVVPKNIVKKSVDINKILEIVNKSTMESIKDKVKAVIAAWRK